MTYCPRCGEYSYERLRTHTYCIDCNHSPEMEQEIYGLPIPAWVFEVDPKLKPTEDDFPFRPKVT